MIKRFTLALFLALSSLFFNDCLVGYFSFYPWLSTDVSLRPPTPPTPIHASAVLNLATLHVASFGAVARMLLQ